MNIKVIECTIQGLPDKYFDEVWEDEETCVQVEKTREVPMFAIKFEAEVDVPVRSGYIYLAPDGGQFVGLSGNRIHNKDMWMEKFSIPTDLILIYSPHIESWLPQSLPH